MPEITDDELAAAKRAFDLIRQLSTNADARPHFERSLKVIDPRIETQEEAAAKVAAPYVEQMSALQKRLDERDEADRKAAEDRQEHEAMDRLNAGFAYLREKEGVTAEGEEKLKALMVKENIASPEAAYAYYLRKNPTPQHEPSAYVPQGWNFDTDLMPNTKDWFADPDKAEDQAIGQVLLEMRRESGES